MDATTDRRANLLTLAGARPAELEELLRYNQSRFSDSQSAELSYPLRDEPFVAEWETYAAAVQKSGSLTALFAFLPELQFPLQSGLRNNPEYLMAMQGAAVWRTEASRGLELTSPERATIFLHASPAGRIPVLLAGCREDFVRLVCAIARKGEPVALPPTMGALMVSGYTNRPRLIRLRKQFFESGGALAEWPAAWTELKKQKALYQDRFVLLSPGPYSSVPAATLGLSEPEWLETSLALRLEHECAHYVTRRVLGAFNGNLLDELLADFWALQEVTGTYSLSWARAFLGLEGHQGYRNGSRLENYISSSAVSPGAFAVLVRLVRSATMNLAGFSQLVRAYREDPHHGIASLLAIATFTLEELSASDAPEVLMQTFEDSFLHVTQSRPRSYKQHRPCTITSQGVKDA